MTRNSIIQSLKLLVVLQIVAVLVCGGLIYMQVSGNVANERRLAESLEINNRLARLFEVNLMLYSNTVARVETVASNRVEETRAQALRLIRESRTVAAHGVSVGGADGGEQKLKLDFFGYFEQSGSQYIQLGNKYYSVGDRVLGKRIEDICPAGVMLEGVFYEAKN